MYAGPQQTAVVVGNGAVGASIAYELSSRGFQVTRVGRENRPYAASLAAGAMLGCFGEVTTSLLASDHGRAKLDMDHRARRYWAEWDERLSQDSGDSRTLFSADGTFVLLNTMGSAAVDSGNFRAIEATLQEYKEPYETADPEDLDWLAPNDLSRSLRGMYIPGEHAVDSHRLLVKLDQALVKSGGRVVDAEALRVRVANGRVTGVELANGEILPADHVVVAAGAKSLALLDEVAEARAQMPPMVSGYGVSVLVETEDRALPSSVVRTPNRAFACGLHAVPRADGVIYLGATNIISEQPRRFAAVGDLQFLLGCAVDQLHTNLSEGSLLSVQVGNRPVPADGFPLVGNAGAEGLWLATGTYRDGLHQSPLLARHIATLVEGGTSEFDFLSSFSPVRAPLAGGTREQVVTTAVEHMMATGYEYKWNVTPEWPPRIERHLRRFYGSLVEELHPTFTPPAELVAAMTDGIRASLTRYYAAWSR
ncbi:NAD(P)/FAD-dependent oxidoreductase [Streptomyces rishiriensis]|uniref:NAD(P)/FAD-dependent oxidoreductase n=1 Tax=Streptomyces rishiriensis TaxID=68264 RepID=UPI000D5954B8|nr:FAD-dependent oxidoreductase [Streptomyces rishiriensis]